MYGQLYGTTTKYYTGWIMPNLTANTDQGITVSANSTANKGTNVWKGFATTSGYTKGYYTGRYANEVATTLNVFITFDTARTITGYTYYTVAVNSNTANSAWKSGILYGSSDNSTWIQLASHGKLRRNATFYQTFTNTTAYKYYKYALKSVGVAYADQINIASFHLLEETQEVGPNDPYDFTITYDNVGLYYINNKYYALKEDK